MDFIEGIIVRSLRSRMGLCYCPGTSMTTTTITTSPKSCSFAHWRRPFLLLYCFLVLQVFPVYKYKITLPIGKIFQFVSYLHQTKVARSMVLTSTVSSVPKKNKLYNFILNILIALITMNIISNTHLSYFFINNYWSNSFEGYFLAEIFKFTLECFKYKLKTIYFWLNSKW